MADWWWRGVMAQNADGRLEYLRAAERGGFRHLWQLTDGSHEVTNFFASIAGSATVLPTITGWSPWTGLAGPWLPEADPVVARNTDGRVEVFVWGQDGALYRHAGRQLRCFPGPSERVSARRYGRV